MDEIRIAVQPPIRFDAEGILIAKNATTADQPVLDWIKIADLKGRISSEDAKSLFLNCRRTYSEA